MYIRGRSGPGSGKKLANERFANRAPATSSAKVEIRGINARFILTPLNLKFNVLKKRFCQDFLTDRSKR